MKHVVREEVVKLEPLMVRYITAAKMLEVSESTIRKLVRQGKLKTTSAGADSRVLVESIKTYAGVKNVQTSA
jgi:excisionase family DNA binding protein